jgi:hypothetical protein
MTTRSSEPLQVLGVLVDPPFLCKHNILVTETVDEVVDGLWRTLSERIDEVLTSETPQPSHVQVLLGEIGAFPHFKFLTWYQSQIWISSSQTR